MKALIDADVLRYEVGAIGEGEEVAKSFDFVREVLDGRIRDINEAVQATEPPTLYLTGATNFRELVAFTKPYKGNRDDKKKPFHFRNLTAYIQAGYETVVSDGLEADDMMAIHQVQATKEGRRTVICTRDKDLRMVPGMHYGWECGKQAEYGPRLVYPDGDLELHKKGKTWKCTGTGMSFFWAQMLMGDATDNIPGCPGIGDKKAYELLHEVPVQDMWPVVRDTYYRKGLDDAVITEQGQLLWMIREMDETGRPVMWEIPTT